MVLKRVAQHLFLCSLIVGASLLVIQKTQALDEPNYGEPSAAAGLGGEDLARKFQNCREDLKLGELGTLVAQTSDDDLLCIQDFQHHQSRSCKEATPSGFEEFCTLMAGSDRLLANRIGEAFLDGQMAVNFKLSQQEIESGGASSDTVVRGLGNAQETAATVLDMRTTWAAMRNIANGIFVVLMVAAIIGYSSGRTEAYSAKKIIPRLVIAAALTQLSWFIAAETSAIIDDLGKGVGAMIEYGTGVQNLDVGQLVTGNFVDNEVTNNAGFATLAASSNSTGAMFTIGLMAIFAGGTLIIALLMLVARKLILTLMVVCAPLALALWALPSTEKWAKTWFSWYFRLLLLYPFMVMLVSLGKILAKAIRPANTDSIADTLLVGGSILVFLTPYLFIPTAIKLATSTIGSLSGLADNASKRLNGAGPKKWAKNQYQGTKGMVNQAAQARLADSDQLSGGKKAILQLASGHAVPTKHNKAQLAKAMDEVESKKEKQAEEDVKVAIDDQNYEIEAHNQAHAASDASKMMAGADEVLTAVNAAGGVDELLLDPSSDPDTAGTMYDLARSILEKDSATGAWKLKARNEVIDQIQNNPSSDAIRQLNKLLGKSDSDPSGIQYRNSGAEARRSLNNILKGDFGSTVNGIKVSEASKVAAYSNLINNEDQDADAMRWGEEFIKTRDPGFLDHMGSQGATANNERYQNTIRRSVQKNVGPVNSSSPTHLRSHAGFLENSPYRPVSGIGQGTTKTILYDAVTGKDKLANVNELLKAFGAAGTDSIQRYNVGHEQVQDIYRISALVNNSQALRTKLQASGDLAHFGAYFKEFKKIYKPDGTLR